MPDSSDEGYSDDGSDDGGYSDDEDQNSTDDDLEPADPRAAPKPASSSSSSSSSSASSSKEESKAPSHHSESKSSSSSSSSSRDLDSEGWHHIDFDSELELLDQIGGGGVGLVYNGWYQDSRVALKTLFDPKIDEDLKQEFMDELRIMAKCKHPNVVTFHGACLAPPNLCFVMELCRCSLFDLLHSNRVDYFSLHQRLAMCHQVSKGLLYLHTLTPPLVHRDIKSHNILVGGDSDSDVTLKLCDFGLVRTKNTTAGTPNYMAPELFGNKPFSASVDVYAFALVMWEIFTQTLPFRGYDAEDIARVVIKGERPDIPTLDVPVECQDIMRRGWSGNEKERPGFEEIEETLRRVLEKTPVKSAIEDLDDDDLFNM